MLIMCHSTVTFVLFVSAFALSWVVPFRLLHVQNGVLVHVPVDLMMPIDVHVPASSERTKEGQSPVRVRQEPAQRNVIDEKDGRGHSSPWYYERGREIEGMERPTRSSRKKEAIHQTHLYRAVRDAPIMEDFRAAAVGSASRSRSNSTDASSSPSSSQQWIMADPLATPTRNHDCIIAKPSKDDALSTYFPDDEDDAEIMVNILGRYSRSVQLWNLRSGRQAEIVTDGTDPAGYPLNDLNHVASVLVDSLDGSGDAKEDGSREIWLPCGFHGDKVNGEISTSYARIVDLRDMKVRLGPELPFSGGACGALPVHVDGPDRPPHICTFGGSVDHHDSGVFVDKTSCYDRVRRRWAHPFGKLPKGMDHLNAAFVPKGACHPSDPARVLLLNYRTMAYAGQSEVILAFDLPEGGWSASELDGSARDPDVPGNWYVFAKPSATGQGDDAKVEESINYGRDASGLLTANGGKVLLNFGGKHNKPKRAYREVRAFDVCQRGSALEKSWREVGSIGFSMYAIQTCVSSSLQIAVSCGGTGDAVQREKVANENSPFCAVNRFSNFALDG